MESMSAYEKGGLAAAACRGTESEGCVDLSQLLSVRCGCRLQLAAEGGCMQHAVRPVLI
eukprot:COSAG06_NODE_1228_length_10179_cov_3.735119_7_plen_59_part_00